MIAGTPPLLLFRGWTTKVRLARVKQVDLSLPNLFTDLLVFIFSSQLPTRGRWPKGKEKHRKQVNEGHTNFFSAYDTSKTVNKKTAQSECGRGVFRVAGAGDNQGGVKSMKACCYRDKPPSTAQPLDR